MLSLKQAYINNSKLDLPSKTILLWKFDLAQSFPKVATEMSLLLISRTAYCEKYGNKFHGKTFHGNTNISDIDMNFKGNRHCRITTDRSYLATSDAVIFEHRSIKMSDLPSFRNPRQRWIIQSHEPPKFSFPASGMKPLLTVRSVRKFYNVIFFFTILLFFPALFM